MLGFKIKHVIIVVFNLNVTMEVLATKESILASLNWRETS